MIFCLPRHIVVFFFRRCLIRHTPAATLLKRRHIIFALYVSSLRLFSRYFRFRLRLCMLLLRHYAAPMLIFFR